MPDFNMRDRKILAAKGMALPDGSYPIRNVADLKNAIQAFGRASDPGRVKAWIIRRARALGATSLLPESWNAGGGGKKNRPDEKAVARAYIARKG